MTDALGPCWDMTVCSEYVWVNTFGLKANWVGPRVAEFQKEKKFDNDGYISSPPSLNV